MPDDGLFILSTGDIAVTAGGDVLQTVDEKCQECGCGESVPSCCATAGRFSYQPETGPVNFTMALQASFTASGWNYRPVGGGALQVAPTVTATASATNSRERTNVGGCRDHVERMVFYRTAGGWAVNPQEQGGNAGGTVLQSSIAFQGATDIYNNIGGPAGALTGYFGTAGYNDGIFDCNATLRTQRASYSPDASYAAQPGFNWAAIVANVSIVAKPFSGWAQAGAGNGGFTQYCYGHTIDVYIDDAGKWASKLNTGAGATGTVSVAMLSAGNYDLTFSVSIPTEAAGGGFVRAAVTMNGTLTVRSGTLPCDGAASATSEGACNSMTYRGTNLPYPPEPMPEGVAQRIVELALGF